MIVRPRGTVVLPHPPRRGLDVFPWINSAQKTLQQLRDRPIEIPIKPTRPAGTGHRFEFKGIEQREDESWGIRISPGTIVYNETHFQGAFEEDDPKPRIIRGVYPKIGDVLINDDTLPTLDLGAKTDGSVWIICQLSKCASSRNDERLILTDRETDPSTEEIENGETAVLLAEFDVITDGSNKSLDNVVIYWEGDWEQPYLCEGTESDSSTDDTSEFDSSGSDTWPSSDSTIPSSDPGSLPSDSSDSDWDPTCSMTMTATWLNRVDCFPVVPGSVSCEPKKFKFQVRVRFWFRGTWGNRRCERYAFGVKIEGGETTGGSPGATSDEYRWINDNTRDLEFEMTPPSCGYLTLQWRMKAFPATASGGGQGCCDSEYSGTAQLKSDTATEPYAIRPLPPTCGAGCECDSSAP